jgi:hypothetical protein
MTRRLDALIVLVFIIFSVAPMMAQKTSLGRRMTIDVAGAPPGQVFDLLARTLQCRIDVDPALDTPVTLRMENAPVCDILAALSRKIGCEWTFDGTNLSIRPLSESRKRRQLAWDEYQRKLKTTLPRELRFTDLTLAAALEAIGTASGLELKPYKGEGGRRVNGDVGGMTVTQALEMLVAQVDGEGVVMVRTPDAGMAQYRLLDKH